MLRATVRDQAQLTPRWKRKEPAAVAEGAEHELLFHVVGIHAAADLLDPAPGGPFSPQHLLELIFVPGCRRGDDDDRLGHVVLTPVRFHSRYSRHSTTRSGALGRTRASIGISPGSVDS